jgi:hypothetical protein
MFASSRSSFISTFRLFQKRSTTSIFSNHGLSSSRILLKNTRKFLLTSVLIAGTVAAGVICTHTTIHTECQSADNEKRTKSNVQSVLFPEIRPYKEGSIKVSDLHTVAYSLYGNPKGKPVLFIHGGPGGGTVPKMAQFFDPKAYHIILVDQRGCGKSTPFANLVDNTTDHLIEDFEKLRKQLKIQKWQLFGGSWGSTLALAYAVSYAVPLSLPFPFFPSFLCFDMNASLLSFLD